MSKPIDDILPSLPPSPITKQKIVRHTRETPYAHTATSTTEPAPGSITSVGRRLSKNVQPQGNIPPAPKGSILPSLSPTEATTEPDKAEVANKADSQTAQTEASVSKRRGALAKVANRLRSATSNIVGKRVWKKELNRPVRDYSKLPDDPDFLQVDDVNYFCKSVIRAGKSPLTAEIVYDLRNVYDNLKVDSKRGTKQNAILKEINEKLETWEKQIKQEKEKLIGPKKLPDDKDDAHVFWVGQLQKEIESVQKKIKKAGDTPPPQTVKKLRKEVKDLRKDYKKLKKHRTRKETNQKAILNEINATLETWEKALKSHEKNR